MPLKVGTQLGPYEILSPLGAGGMGEVYRATDRLTGQDVALKKVTISPNQLLYSTRVENADQSLALAQEFKTLASLRHPHIVSVLDYGFDQQGTPYFTMDLLANSQNIVEAGQDQPQATQVEFLLQMLQALAYLHRRGILHRDLKPNNVLVTDNGQGNGQVKLLDFGLSAAIERSEADQIKTMAGTIAYMAPEIFQGQPASRRADLYAVGMIAYELFAGRYPYDESSLATLMIEVLNVYPDITSIGVSPEVAAVLARLLSKTGEARYQSAVEVIRELCAAAGRPLPPETAAIRESYLQAAAFVGRESEMDQLIQALSQAANGPGSLWLVGGECGRFRTRAGANFFHLARSRWRR
jgi:serine/threonine protein kinase